MFDQFMENVVEEHNERRRCEGDAFVAKDMVDRLLQLADDPNLEVKLTRDSVKAFTQVCLYSRLISVLCNKRVLNQSLLLYRTSSPAAPRAPQ